MISISPRVITLVVIALWLLVAAGGSTYSAYRHWRAMKEIDKHDNNL